MGSRLWRSIIRMLTSCRGPSKVHSIPLVGGDGKSRARDGRVQVADLPNPGGGFRLAKECFIAPGLVLAVRVSGEAGSFMQTAG